MSTLHIIFSNCLEYIYRAAFSPEFKVVVTRMKDNTNYCIDYNFILEFSRRE